jgi:glutamine synthetase
MKNLIFKTENEVLNFIEKNKKILRFVRVIFPDVLGREMSFCIPSEKMKSVFKQGAGFDGSSVEGFARVEESDLIILPDPKTFRVLPWNYELSGATWKEAVVFGDIFTSKGHHFEGDSRYVLKRVLERTKNFGELYFGPELEFFIFGSENKPELMDHGGYFHGGKSGTIRKLTQIYLQEMGIGVECDHHEVAPSQHEINLKYNKALSMADSVILAKYVIKRVTRELGFFASFMPKPITKINGSGMHLHLSLWKKGKNVFFKKGKEPLSDSAKKYLTGLIKYGREIQIVLNQWVNSYKRLIPGYEAPVYLAWGRKNRSAYIRVPETHLTKAETATRIELRSPDPACNIYLALAAIQSAGVQGIKENLKFSAPEEKDIFEMTKNEMNKKNIKTLSKNLKEALEKFKKGKLAKEALGEHLFKKIIQNKEIEWKRYEKSAGRKFETAVSPYEIKEYLPIL